MYIFIIQIQLISRLKIYYDYIFDYMNHESKHYFFYHLWARGGGRLDFQDPGHRNALFPLKFSKTQNSAQFTIMKPYFGPVLRK